MVNRDLTLRRTNERRGIPPQSFRPIASRNHGLPETHREVVLMRFVDGLSLDEIATALDIPLGTVKSRLHNALNALRADPRVRKYFEP